MPKKAREDSPQNSSSIRTRLRTRNLPRAAQNKSTDEGRKSENRGRKKQKVVIKQEKQPDPKSTGENLEEKFIKTDTENLPPVVVVKQEKTTIEYEDAETAGQQSKSDLKIVKTEPEQSKKATKGKTLKRKVKKEKFDQQITDEETPQENVEMKSEVTAPVARKKARKVPVVDLELKTRMLNKTCTQKNKYIGAHVSISGGLWNAVNDAVKLGARAFGLFLKNQRQWTSKPLDEEDAGRFKTLLQDYGFSPSMVVPHGSYLMNCGSPNKDILQKSRDMLIDELHRCEKLGLDIFNFHPGSTCGEISTEESVQLIADSINTAIEQSKHVIVVIENMSCQGNTIGGKFEELAAIIDKVKDKSRIGVCLDTCHMFAAGYDIKSEEGYESVMKEFDEVVGFKYLKAVHLNDSAGKLGCHRDLHANIGQGCIGLKAFKRLMNDQRFDNIPFILETPQDDYSKEILMLNKLID